VGVFVGQFDTARLLFVFSQSANQKIIIEICFFLSARTTEHGPNAACLPAIRVNCQRPQEEHSAR